jgi:hypothetical protein
VPRINEDKNLSTFTVVKMSKDFIKREQKRKNNSKKRTLDFGSLCGACRSGEP